MSDPNIADFYSRIHRIQKARARGFGFEAEGTLGRSHSIRATRRRRGWLKPLVLLFLCVFGLKAMIFYNIGSDVYEHRLEALSAGEGFEPLGAWFMQADPVTRSFADGIARAVGWLRQS